MLASNGGERRQQPAPWDGAPEEGPSAEELAAPISDSDSAASLLRSVQRTQEVRIAVAERFEELFEFLVTGGRADEYSGLVTRFKARFEALSGNLERAAALLDAAKQAPLARLVRGIAREEAAHLDEALKVQVLRQRLSVCEAESEAAAGLKKQLAAAGAAVAARREAVFESLEELRCEAADLEE